MGNKITITNNDEWAGVYIDGKLFTEGHGISIFDIESLLTHLKFEVEIKEANQEWLEGKGRLPESLNEVQWQKE